MYGISKPKVIISRISFEQKCREQIPRYQVIEKMPGQRQIYSVGMGGGTVWVEKDFGTVMHAVGSLINSENRPTTEQKIGMSKNPSVTRESKYPS